MDLLDRRRAACLGVRLLRGCIAYAFFVAFMKYPLQGSLKHVVEYLPFVILALAGPFLRPAAWTLRDTASVAVGLPNGLTDCSPFDVIFELVKAN